MRVVGPRLQLSSAIMLFGIASACLLAAKGYASVMGLRVLVGVGEAFTQTGLLCFTLWYRREEMATRGGASKTRFFHLIPFLYTIQLPLYFFMCYIVCCHGS
jgi:hypothetical protein